VGIAAVKPAGFQGMDAHAMAMPPHRAVSARPQRPIATPAHPASDGRSSCRATVALLGVLLPLAAWLMPPGAEVCGQAPAEPVEVSVLLRGADPTDRPVPENEGTLPMAAEIGVDMAYLRAGPGDDFYPTERLALGRTLEVWAIDATGWCAVRPVEGSFSWVRAADIDDEAALDPVARSPSGEVRAGVGVVIADGAVARVGSQLNDLRHVAQVRLEAGERVLVLDRVRIDRGRHAGLWARIEPPAGMTPASSAAWRMDGDDARSAWRTQRNSPAGGSIRAHRPACRPRSMRARSRTRTRSPASRRTWATWRRSLSCDPTRATAPSATTTPTPAPA
jgi:hypothetical protein